MYEDQLLLALAGITLLVIVQFLAGHRTRARLKDLASRSRQLTALIQLDAPAQRPKAAVRREISPATPAWVRSQIEAWAVTADIDDDFSEAMAYVMRNWATSSSSDVLTEGARRHLEKPGISAIHIERQDEDTGIAWFEDAKGNRDYLTFKGSLCSGLRHTAGRSRQPERAVRA